MSMFHVSMTLLDADGNTGSLVAKVPEGVLTAAEIRQFAQDWVSITDPVTEAQITKVSIRLDATLPGSIKAAPDVGSNIQEGGLLSFNALGTAYRYAQRIPAFKQIYFSGKAVNQTQAEVAAYLSTMLIGLACPVTMVIPCDKYENDLISVVSATKSFRRK